MKKINEFVNNKNDISIIFNELSDKLDDETGFLSAFNEIEENENFQKLLSLGDKIVPILINHILNVGCSLIYYVMLSRIVGGIKITKGNEGNREKLKKDIGDWWEKNIKKYER